MGSKMSASNSSAERIALWDNLKFFLMLCVAVGHFANCYVKSDVYKSLFVFVYAFHMPLFIFVSGLFHKNVRIFQKVFSYLSIYIVFHVLCVLIKLLQGKNTNISLLADTEAPWYMLAFAAFIVLAYLFRNVNKKYLLVISVLLAVFVGYDKSIGDLLELSRIIVFWPFYLLGTMLSRKKIERFTENKYLRLAGLIVVIAWGLVCLFYIDSIYYLRPLFTGRNPFNGIFEKTGFLFRLLTYVITTAVGLGLILIIPRSKIPLITLFGQRTLQVYMWHIVILYAVEDFAAVVCTTPTGKLIWLLIGAITAFVTSLKLFSFPTTTILKYASETE